MNFKIVKQNYKVFSVIRLNNKHYKFLFSELPKPGTVH